MIREEIDREAEKALTKIGPAKIQEFLESFDDDSSASEPARMTPHELGGVVAELKGRGMVATLIPTRSLATLDNAIDRLAKSWAAKAEDAAEISAQLKAATRSKEWKDAQQKIELAIARIAAKYGVEPDPFAAAVLVLENEKRSADNHGISRDPIALMPLVGELLQIPAYIAVDIELHFKDGRANTQVFGWTMPIVKSKKCLINALSGFIMGNAALAKDLGSPALEKWKCAINQMWNLVHIDERGAFVEHTARSAWPEKAVAALFKSIEEARAEAFADGMISNYLANGKEVM